MKALLFLVLLCICARADASDTEFHLGRFSSGDLTGWKEQTIGLLKPKTSSLVRSAKAIDTKHNELKAKETPQKEPKQKDQPPKGIKVNGETTLPPPVIPQQEKPKDEPKQGEPNVKEQPSGATTPPPAAAPQPALVQ